MQIAVIGIDHTVANISIRECVAKFFLKYFGDPYKKLPFDISFVLLQTCNRSELYFSCPNLPEANQWLTYLLKKEASMYDNMAINSFYTFCSIDCFEHLIQVSCGCKSAIFGETAIQGQIKRSYDESRKRALSKELHFLFQKSLKEAKAIRKSHYHQLHLIHPSSIEHTIYERILDHVEHPEVAPVLFIGASCMNNRIAHYLHSRGIRNRIICNRSHLKKSNYTQIAPWENLEESCNHAPIIIVATTAREILISQNTLKRAPKNKLLIDLAMPRNIEPNLCFEHTLLNIDAFIQKSGSPPIDSKEKLTAHIKQLANQQVALFRKKTAFSADRKLSIAI